MARQWPMDQVEHELRSIRRYLRRYRECPDEVRINDYEGTFIRPSLRFVVVSSNMQKNGMAITALRSLTVVWFGSESKDSSFVESEARSALDWLVQSLVRGDESLHGAIPVYDWSNANSPAPTPAVVDVDYASISGQLIRDEAGLFSVPVDFRYNVRTRVEHFGANPSYSPPFVTNLDLDVNYG